jgi:predicted RNase H-like nuclease (RuvC/YqgF family)
METLDIILGAVLSIGIFLLGYSAAGVFTGKKRTDDLEKYIDSTDMRISELEKEISYRVDQEVNNINDYIKDTERDFQSQLDSRLDKLENKFRGDIASGVEVRKVIDKNELLEQRLNRFIETYQNQ